MYPKDLLRFAQGVIFCLTTTIPFGVFAKDALTTGSAQDSSSTPTVAAESTTVDPLAPMLGAENKLDKKTAPDEKIAADQSKPSESERVLPDTTQYKNLPFRKSDISSMDQGVSAYLILMTLLVFVVLVLYFFRRHLSQKGMLPNTSEHRLRYVERCRLNTNSHVYLVSLDNNEFLIADNGHGISIYPNKHSINKNTHQNNGDAP